MSGTSSAGPLGTCCLPSFTAPSVICLSQGRQCRLRPELQPPLSFFFFFSLKVIIGPFDGLLISGKLKVGLAYLVLSHCHLVLEPVTSSYVFIYLLTVLKVAVSS